MGETLDVLMGHVDEATMTELVPQLGSVLRSGVGLNTKSGHVPLHQPPVSAPRLARAPAAAGKLFKRCWRRRRRIRPVGDFGRRFPRPAAVARHAH